MKKNKYVFLVLLLSCLEPAPALEENLKDTKINYVCSPINCSGCCRNNICRGGNDNDACGYDGRLCKECLSGAVCSSPGTCIGYGQLPTGSLPDSGCFVMERKLLCW
jgi:hypothetical protein